MGKRMALFSVALSLMFSFLIVGYAALSDSLSIKGKTSVEVPAGLFITDIEFVKSSGLDVESVSFDPYSTTVTTKLSKRSNSTAGSVTYRITVLNNTSHVYTYRKLYYQTNVEDNSLVSTTNNNSRIWVNVNYPKVSNANRLINPGESLEFEVTYTLGRNSSLASRNTYTNILNYQFGINVNSEAEAVNAVYEKFLNILNNTSTYLTLVDVLDNKYDGSNEWTSNYVGNVGDATSDDALTVNTLFAGQLELVIAGQTRPATVLIKHENLDNDRNTGDDYIAKRPGNTGQDFYGYGCEMTLYLTTHSLKRSDSSDGNAPVYVAVFTCDRDANGNIVGNWYKIGDSYYGYANIVGYNGEGNGEGSFVTDNWKAYPQRYTITDNYSYNVASGATIKSIVQTTDVNAERELVRLLDEARDIINDIRYAGTGIEDVEFAYLDARKYYTVDANGNHVINSGYTRAELCPILHELAATIETAKKNMEEANQTFLNS